MIGDTYDALHRYVGRLMSETPKADPQFLALTFICAEIDKMKDALSKIEDRGSE